MQTVKQCVYCDRFNQYIPLSTCEECKHHIGHLECNYPKKRCGHCGGTKFWYSNPKIVCDKCHEEVM